MVEFVKEQENTLGREESVGFLGFTKNVINYANFLSQPLTLGMFVPCDEAGNVLDAPDAFDIVSSETYRTNLYRQAKDRVLFEGFEITRTHNLTTENPCYVVSNGEKDVTFHIGLYNFCEGVKFAINIENLTFIQPTLTTTAINKINK